MIELTNPTDSEQIIHTDGNVGILFTTPFCGPCRMLKPMLAKNEKDLSPTVKLYWADASGGMLTIAQKYSVKAVPTLILFKDGEFAKSLHGMGEITVNNIKSVYLTAEEQSATV